MTSKIKEAAEKYASANYDSSMNQDCYHKEEDLTKAVEFGANFMLEEMSKGGEFREFYKSVIYNPEQDEEIDVLIHTVDIAALQSANAKIAKLTEALEEAYEVYAAETSGYRERIEELTQKLNSLTAGETK